MGRVLLISKLSSILSFFFEEKTQVWSQQSQDGEAKVLLFLLV